MRRLSPFALLVCAIGLLSACQLSGEGTGLAGPDGDVTPNAVTGDEIEVTALDAPAGDGSAPPDATSPPAAPDTAAPQAEPAEDGPASEVTEAAAEPEPQAELAAPPVTPKSDQQLACEKKGGKWFKVGKGDKRACVRQTKDAGKRCEKESQCDGVCLARSGTCSPFKPLFGCHEILQDNGARVTLCLE